MSDTPTEDCVAVLAPTGQDATLAERVLKEAGFVPHLCASMQELCAALRGPCGVAIIAAEALAHPEASLLEDVIALQPPWSDLPVVVLTAGMEADAPLPRTARLQELGNVTLLDRPLRVMTLVYALRSALRARRRQYEVRDYLVERERMEARMRDGQRLESLGVLAGGIAHDFNNLLTAILGNAELLLDDYAGVPGTEERLRDVIDASRQAANLTAQMLAYAGKGHVAMELVDVSALVASIVRLLQGSVTSAVELKLELADALPRVSADIAQLQQVVMNLVINGAESMAGNAAGAVAISTHRAVLTAADIAQMDLTPAPGEYVTLVVRDSGRGMDEATLARIFEPFFSTKFAGRGLGLSAVYGIIRRHGGGLKISSRIGTGTTFEVSLPIAAEPKRSSAGDQANRSAKRLLVVDDDAAVRRFVRYTLEKAGYEVIAAENGSHAVTELQRLHGEVALVLLDATMPVMTGERAIPHLKAVRPDLKIVVMSGFGAAQIAEHHPDPAVVGHLAKPFPPAALLAAVEKAIKIITR